MVKFAVQGRHDQAKAFLLGLTDVHPQESTVTVAETKVKVQVPAKALLAGAPAKKGKTRVTLQYVVNTGNIQVWTSTELEDEVREVVKQLEGMCVEWQGAPAGNKPALEAISPAVEFFRAKTTRPTKPQEANLPSDQAYAEATDAIMENVTLHLQHHPIMRDRVLEVLGAFVPDPDKVPEGEGARSPNADWTPA